MTLRMPHIDTPSFCKQMYQPGLIDMYGLSSGLAEADSRRYAQDISDATGCPVLYVHGASLAQSDITFLTLSMQARDFGQSILFIDRIDKMREKNLEYTKTFVGELDSYSESLLCTIITSTDRGPVVIRDDREGVVLPATPDATHRTAMSLAGAGAGAGAGVSPAVVQVRELWHTPLAGERVVLERLKRKIKSLLEDECAVVREEGLREYNAQYIVAVCGDAEAQFRVGKCYYVGYGVDQSDAQTFEWYRKAAGQGHADAQHNLGLIKVIAC